MHKFPLMYVQNKSLFTWNDQLGSSYLNLTRFSPFCPLGKLVNVMYTPVSYCSTHSSFDALVPFCGDSDLVSCEFSTDLVFSWQVSLLYLDFNVSENTMGLLDRLSTCLSFDNPTSGGKWVATIIRRTPSRLSVYTGVIWGRLTWTPSFASFLEEAFSDIVWSCSNSICIKYFLQKD